MAPAGRAACAAEVAALERNVEAARAKGKMLRRQQLANQLDHAEDELRKRKSEAANN